MGDDGCDEGREGGDVEVEEGNTLRKGGGGEAGGDGAAGGDNEVAPGGDRVDEGEAGAGGASC